MGAPLISTLFLVYLACLVAMIFFNQKISFYFLLVSVVLSFAFAFCCIPGVF